MPIEEIFKNGVIKLKNKKYIKIMKVIPINFNLKSSLEKKAILNSYKIFLKTCNFNIQILIQSNKENLKKNIFNIEKNIKMENKNCLNKLSKEYISYIKNINSVKNASSKVFFIIIENTTNLKIKNKNCEEIIFQELNEKFIKIKECLSRCGNIVQDINNKKNIEKLLFSFFNVRLNLKKE